jgi:hypothetical protein
MVFPHNLKIRFKEWRNLRTDLPLGKRNIRPIPKTQSFATFAGLKRLQTFQLRRKTPHGHGDSLSAEAGIQPAGWRPESLTQGENAPFPF